MSGPADELQQQRLDQLSHVMDHVAKIQARYEDCLVGFIDVDPVSRTVPGVLIETPERSDPTELVLESGKGYLIMESGWLLEARVEGIEEGVWYLCRPPVYPTLPPRPFAVVLTSPARPGHPELEPEAQAWVPGTGGVVPLLVDVGNRQIPWLLHYDCVYDIRDDLHAGRWAVSEFRPDTMTWSRSNPLIHV